MSIKNPRFYYFLILLNRCDFYFFLNNLIWQEGLFLDFLQKKITDNWIRKILILSSVLFNEKIIFDKLIKSYLFLIIWPSSHNLFFNINNLSFVFSILIFIFLFVFFCLYLTFFLMI